MAKNENPLLNMMKWDFKLQKAYKISIIYGLVMIVYIILLLALQLEDDRMLLSMLIFTDPALLGFMFIGAIVYFEKSENVLNALSTSPMRIGTYLKSKAGTFCIMSVYTSVIIALFVRVLDANYILLIIGVGLTSIIFTLFGFAVSSKFTNFNEFLITAIAYNLIFLAPLFSYMGLFDTYFIYLIPTQASLLLIDGAFGGMIETWQIIYSILYLLVICILMYYFAVKSFKNNIILHGGASD